MKKLKSILFLGLLFTSLFFLTSCNLDEESLNTQETRVYSKEANMVEKAMSTYVTKQGGTEKPFDNAYWDEKRPGIYVDINTGEPLFSSLDKYDSGTGWPSFTKPIERANILEKEDKKLGATRTEVRTEASHLGHVFEDGPNGGDRYCINSAAMDFIPLEDLYDRGYGDYIDSFNYEKATLAGGCFWGVEKLLSEVDGIISVKSGYTGGTALGPTYQEVSTGKTGHAEAVELYFDPQIITYAQVLDYFWRLHDPTTENRQGVDVGTQYRSAIFYHNEEQKEIAIKSKDEFDAKKVFSKPAVTQIVPASEFYSAEDYHQDFYDNNPGRICHALRDE